MSGGEILLILLVMLLLFGSKKLPEMARSIGKSMESFRRASREMTDEIMRADLHDPPARPSAGAGAPASLPEGPTVRPSGGIVHRDDESTPS